MFGPRRDPSSTDSGVISLFTTALLDGKRRLARTVAWYRQERSAQRAGVAPTCRPARYHIRSLGLFGSYGRGTPSRRSDIDILVSFTETPSLFAFVRLKGELERLGRRVDLVMREALRPSIGRRILAEVSDA